MPISQKTSGGFRQYEFAPRVRSSQSPRTTRPRATSAYSAPVEVQVAGVEAGEHRHCAREDHQPREASVGVPRHPPATYQSAGSMELSGRIWERPGSRQKSTLGIARLSFLS
jgi:hypothetical protein